MNINDQVERYEDMSPTGRLCLVLQNDSDVIITVIEDGKGMLGSPSVEFCLSGGQSPNTRKALLSLIDAMKKDNQENEQFRT